jgi:DNA-binding HxlR family transcriptional regulator
MILIALRIPNPNRYWDLMRGPQTRNAPDGKQARGFVMANLRRIYGCPVELSLELLGGKWKSVILARLKQTTAALR